MYHLKNLADGMGDSNPCPSTAPYFCDDPRNAGGACCPVSDCSVCVAPLPSAGAEDCISYDQAYNAAGVGVSPCALRDEDCIAARTAAVANFSNWWTSTKGNCHSISDVPAFTGPSSTPAAASGSATASTAPVTVSSSVPATQVTKPYSASSVPTTQATSTYSASSTPAESTGTTATTAAATGFSLDSIPWWGWALAAGAGLLALKR